MKNLPLQKYLKLATLIRSPVLKNKVIEGVTAAYAPLSPELQTQLARLPEEKQQQLRSEPKMLNYRNINEIATKLNDPAYEGEPLPDNLKEVLPGFSKRMYDAQNVHVQEYDQKVNASMLPVWLKKRFLTKGVPANENAFDTIDDVAEYQCNHLVEHAESVLYPSDWIEQYLKIKDPKEPDYAFWKKTFADTKALDADHEKHLQKYVEIINGNFIPDENLQALPERLLSSKATALKSFKTQLDQILAYRKETLAKAEALADKQEKFLNAQDPKDKYFTAKKEQWSRFRSSWKKMTPATQDPGIALLFTRYISPSLMKSSNIALFTEFNVDSKFIAQYKEREAVQAARANEKQDLVEAYMLKFMDINSQLDAEIKKSFDQIDQMGKDLDDFLERLPYATMREELDRHPEWEKRMDWDIARHRWDYTMSDEDYKQALAVDKSWWNLPRNP